MPFGNLNIWEILLLVLLVLLLFGAKRLPEIGASLGKGIREFKGSIKEMDDEVRGELKDGGSERTTDETRDHAGSRSEPAERREHG